MMFTGCNGSKQEDSGEAQGAGGASEEVLDFKVSDYVKLGDYKGLTVTYPSVMEITDEDVQEQIQYELEENTEYEEVKDRGAQEGDIVNMDFKGTVDGEEFEGGTASGYELELGAGEFLEEFESNLTGKKAGEKFTFKMTFPEDYDETVGGKEAEFAVTVNSVSEALVPEYDEDFVKSVSEYETVKDYEASVREQLEQEEQDSSKMEAEENALRMAIENAKLDGYPQKLYDFFYDDTVTGYKNYAELMGMDYEEFLDSFMSEEDIAQMVEDQVNEYLVAQAILEAEGKEVSDSEYKELGEKMAKDNEYDSLEEYEGDYGAVYIRTQVVREKAIGILYDAASLKEVPYEEYHADDEESWEDDEEEDSEADSEEDADDGAADDDENDLRLEVDNDEGLELEFEDLEE